MERINTKMAMLVVVLLAVGAAACDDGGTTTPRRDDGGVRDDAVTPDDGGVPDDAVTPDEVTPPRCPNGVCDPGETTASCPADCPPEGALSCILVDWCRRCCPSGDTPCAEACVGAGTAAAQDQLEAFVNCWSTSCATECGAGGTQEACRTCINANCSAESNACDLGPAGAGGCWTLMDCLRACPALPAEGSGSAATCPDDEGLVCWNDCFTASDSTGVNLFIALNQCVADNCATECAPGSPPATCQTCAQGACMPQIAACQRDG